MCEKVVRTYNGMSGFTNPTIMPLCGSVGQDANRVFRCLVYVPSGRKISDVDPRDKRKAISVWAILLGLVIGCAYFDRISAIFSL